MPSQKDLIEIDSQIEDFLSEYNIPGASLAISKNGKLVYQKAYGLADQSQNKPMEIGTQMRVASVSKSFTGLAIMLLVQDGKIALEDKVFGEGAILGTNFGSKPYSNRVKQVTVKHLLQMTTGGWVVNGNRDAIDYEQQRTNAGFFDWMMDNASLTFDPGTQYLYINTNYFVAARIVEEVS
ncbi:MAG TPA: serine hydrolase, partial [Algoriphagus sp.]|nr:serine hydrolase [Algoriphagus sp.]